MQLPASQCWSEGQSALLEHATHVWLVQTPLWHPLAAEHGCPSATPQTPPAHALAFGHAFPQAPQLLASLVTSVHVPPQQVPLVQSPSDAHVVLHAVALAQVSAPGHGAGAPQLPVASHVSMRLLAQSPVAPGAHWTQAPCRQTGSAPLHFVCPSQVPTGPQTCTTSPEHVRPWAHTPVQT